jgi:hypothetical protein
MMKAGRLEVLILEQRFRVCLTAIIYRSRWNKESTLHILPHWNWEGREGEVTPFITNYNSAELL